MGQQEHTKHEGKAKNQSCSVSGDQELPKSERLVPLAFLQRGRLVGGKGTEMFTFSSLSEIFLCSDRTSACDASSPVLGVSCRPRPTGTSQAVQMVFVRPLRGQESRKQEG